MAKAIESPLMRQAIKVTLAHPRSVFMGEKVRGLHGIRRVVVCRLIGDDGVGVGAPDVLSCRRFVQKTAALP